MSEQPKYSVVVPVYCSETTLPTLYERVATVFDGVLQSSFELLLVDDSSKDDSWSKMQELRARDCRVKILQLARNFGQHNALMCGFTYAAGEYIITMDDDLQHPPEEIPKLVQALEACPEADVVIGAYSRKKHSWLRNLGTYGMSLVGRHILGNKSNVSFTSFRLVRNSVVKAILEVRIEKPRVGQLILATTNHIINVTVSHDERKHGRSGYTFPRLVRDFLSSIFNNSALPLKVVSHLGFASAFASLLLTFYYFCRYFIVGVAVAGWTTLVLLILFYSGLLLFSMGVIGEYLIRILKEGKRMPQFVVRSKQL